MVTTTAATLTTGETDSVAAPSSSITTTVVSEDSSSVERSITTSTTSTEGAAKPAQAGDGSVSRTTYTPSMVLLGVHVLRVLAFERRCMVSSMSKTKQVPSSVNNPLHEPVNSNVATGVSTASSGVEASSVKVGGHARSRLVVSLEDACMVTSSV